MIASILGVHMIMARAGVPEACEEAEQSTTDMYRFVKLVYRKISVFHCSVVVFAVLQVK